MHKFNNNVNFFDFKHYFFIQFLAKTIVIFFLTGIITSVDIF